MRKTNYYNSIYIERKQMSERTKIAWAIVIVAFIICFFMVLPVNGKGTYGNGVSEETYQAWEKEYRGEIKEVLEKKGLEMSGITMTKTFREDGARDYEVIIHHERIAKLGYTEKTELVEALQTVDFPENQSDFTFVLRCDLEGKSL
ncbi:MAG: hypothetical protein K6E48_03685 [Lachnospiraceae bacterium]|nr:hypothetical protein [Lachnospiraceae bacterium]